MNAELRTIFEADQADRRSALGPGAMERDEARRRRVRELLAAGEVVDAHDHYRAAMVLQHGDSRESFRQARELALRSVQLGHRPARWLAAAALDRLLVRQGRRQRYGTQYRRWGDDLMLIEVDPATTDSERAEWGVPPLAVAMRRARGVIPPDPTPPVVVDGIEVQVYRTGPARATGRRTIAEPLAEAPRPRPWLPAGVQLLRSIHGITARTPCGSWSVTWTAQAMSPDQPVLIDWEDWEGDQGAPRMELVELAGAPAALVEREATGMRWLVRGAGPGLGWFLVGVLPRADLLRVGGSLPRADRRLHATAQMFHTTQDEFRTSPGRDAQGRVHPDR